MGRTACTQPQCLYKGALLHHDQTHVHYLYYVNVTVNHNVKVTIAPEGNTAVFGAEIKNYTLRSSHTW
jgi:hypothetical protein